MIKNYLTTALRNLLRNRISSCINIAGLTIGIAVTLLVGLWIYDEVSFNTYHRNADRIAQVMVRGVDAKDGAFLNNSLQYPLAAELKTNYADHFKHIVRATPGNDRILSAGEKKLSATGQFMEADAPEMLTLKMLYGDWSALHDPHSIILAASVARALFGNGNPVNRLVMLNNKSSLKVTGVYEDLPKNTQFNNLQFLGTWDFWISQNEWIKERAMNDWHNHFLRIYVEIPDGSDFAAVSHVIKDIELRSIVKLEGYEKDVARKPQLFLHPMKRWHLYPFNKGVTDDKPVRMVWMVGIVGCFVLLLACINFINLSTARSEKRAKEVGIRKTIGSMRHQLVYQFFSESLMVVIFSFVLACILTGISLPWFNDLSAKEMKMPWLDGNFWLAGTVFIVITAILAGLYPALYLSSFRPVAVLKGTITTGRWAALPRKALVVLQFTVSIALIISTIVVYRQIQVAKDRPVGYTREGLMAIKIRSDDFKGKYDLLRNELLRSGVVFDMSGSMGKVTELASNNNGFSWRGKDLNDEESLGSLAVTYDHGRTVGWQFTAGRDFSRDVANDSSGVVINESAAKYMNLQNPVGETITWKWRDKDPKLYTIIGVVRDMVMESPYDPVDPTLFFIKALNGGISCINIRVHPRVAMSQAIPKIEAVFRKIVPAVPFDYSFVDQDYALKFAAEERIGKLAGFFTVLAIFISCLGLFGLASFVAEQRTREIGVRKVLGASVFDVWRLLSKEFVMLVMIALCISGPVAWSFMQSWLENYQYRTEVSWWIVAGTGLLAVFITLLTVSFHAIKAALMNPVRSLRSE
jgi:ABC-type antimicrobial peptide transport system permease subunit